MAVPWDGQWVVACMCPCERFWPPKDGVITLVLRDGVYWAMHPGCVATVRLP